MGELIGAALFAVLAAYILWESFSNRMTCSGAESQAGFVPGKAASDTALLVSAAVFAVWGVALALDPSQPPFTGRGAFILAALYAALGTLGLPLVHWVLAVALAAMWSARCKRCGGTVAHARV